MKLILLVVSVFCIFLWNIVSAETGEILNNKSINEIKSDINQLHIDRNNINNELTILTQDNNFISYLVKNSYFKSTITQDELTNIETLVITYNSTYSDINKQLLDKSKNLEDISLEKKQLLDIKKNLYQELIPYIKQELFNDYIEFIKWDADILKRESDVKSQLIQNKEILTTKVTQIENRIIKEREKLSENLKSKVLDKINEQILDIQNNPKFIWLSDELKVIVIEKTIDKVVIKIDSTKKSVNKDTILEQKIEIYELLLTKLIEYKNTIDIKKEWE